MSALPIGEVTKGLAASWTEERRCKQLSDDALRPHRITYRKRTR